MKYTQYKLIYPWVFREKRVFFTPFVLGCRHAISPHILHIELSADDNKPGQINHQIMIAIQLVLSRPPIMSLRTNHSAFHYVATSLNKALDLLPMLQAVSAGLALLEPWISTNRECVQLFCRLLADRYLLNLEVSFAANFLLKSSHSSTKFADRVRNTMKR